MSSDLVLNQSTILGASPSGVRPCRAPVIRDVVYRPGARFDWHDHPHASLFVVLRGRIDEQAGSTRNQCEPGTVGFLPAEGRHRSQFAHSGVRTLSIELNAEWLETVGRSAGPRSAPGFTRNSFITASALRLHALEGWLDPVRQLAAEEIVVDLFDWATQGELKLLPASARTRARRRLREVSELLAHSRSKDLTLRSVAAKSGRDPAHLSREFHAAFGCSLSQFHMLARIEQASFLLRASNHSLASVATQSGFYDQCQFTRAFRRATGRSPGQYRSGFKRGSSAA